MAHISADRVRDTSTTTGTGALTVSGTAPTGYRTFSDVCSASDTFWYAIQHQSANEWEVGLGTYSDTDEITRTAVLASTNSNSAVNFSAGTKDVFITLTAGKTVQLLPDGTVDLPAGSTVDGDPIGSGYTILFEGTNVLDQYSSTSAQSYRIYNTRTDGSNYERGGFVWNSNRLEIRTEAAGTGSNRDIRLVPSSGNVIIDGGVQGSRTLYLSSGNLALDGNFGVGSTLFLGNGWCRVDGSQSDGLVISQLNSGTGDFVLKPNSTGVIEMKNDANPITHRIYKTTDGTNYERVKFGWNSNVFEIKPEAGGTGTARLLHISGLPTSNPGAGILWNDGGTVKVGT